MTQPIPPPRHSQRVAIPLTVVVAAITSGIAYYATQDAPPSPGATASAYTATTVRGSAHSIVLPRSEVELPPGPHQREFAVACTTCHSAQIVLNQPAFPRAKWTELVQKMVKTFGAPISAAEEPALVEYLVAIRGK
jgi:hypothetical protein